MKFTSTWVSVLFVISEKCPLESEAVEIFYILNPNGENVGPLIWPGCAKYMAIGDDMPCCSDCWYINM